MKKVLKIILSIVIFLVMFFIAYVIDIKVCDSKLGRFCYITIEKLGTQDGEELDNFSKTILYEYLSSEYKSYISKEKYEKIHTIYEAKEFFDSIPIEVNITSINNYRYMNTDWFNTPIGNGYQDRRESFIYDVVLGMEGWTPVIKRFNINIRKF